MNVYYDPNDKKKRYTPVESVINISDPTIAWYNVEGYNGYEVSSNGYVRSMKHYKRYPYGILIKTDKSGMFTLSNNQNERIQLSFNQIYDIATHNPRGLHPVPTYYANIGSRNKQMFIRKKHTKPQFDNTPKPAKFTITDKLDYSTIQCPVIDMYGGKYYGRKNS